MTVHGRGKYVSVVKRNALAAATTAAASSPAVTESVQPNQRPNHDQTVAAPGTTAVVNAAAPNAPPRVVPSSLPLPADFGYSKIDIATLVRQYLQTEFPVVAKLFEHEAKHILKQCDSSSATPRSLYSIMREFVELKSAQRLSNAIRDYQRIRQPPAAIVGVLQGLNQIIGEYESRREEFDNVDFNAAVVAPPAPTSSTVNNNVLAQGTVSPAFASFFTTPINNATVSHSSFLPTAAPTSSRALASAFAPSPSSNIQPSLQAAAVSSSSSSSHSFAQPLPPVSRLQPSVGAIPVSSSPNATAAATSTELTANSATASSGPPLILPSNSPNKRRRKGSSPKKRIIPTVVSNTETNPAGLLTEDAELSSNTLLEYLRGSVSKLQSIGLDMRVNPEGVDALEHNTDLAVVLANYINQTNPFEKHLSHPQPSQTIAPATAAAAMPSSSPSAMAAAAANPDFLQPAPQPSLIAHTTSTTSSGGIEIHQQTAMDTLDPDAQGGVESFALSDDILREITEKCLQDRTTAAFIDNAFAFNPNRQAESMWSPTSQDSASIVEFETPMDSTTYTENSPHKSPHQQQEPPTAAATSRAHVAETARSRSPAKAQSQSHREELPIDRNVMQPSPIRATLRSASNVPIEAANTIATTTNSRTAPTILTASPSPSRSHSASSGIATRSLTVALNVSSASPRLRRGADVSHQSMASATAASSSNSAPAPLHSTSSNASATSNQESAASVTRKKRKAESPV